MSEQEQPKRRGRPPFTPEQRHAREMARAASSVPLMPLSDLEDNDSAFDELHAEAERLGRGEAYCDDGPIRGQEVEDLTPMLELHAENERLRDLIRWLAPRIERRTQNGTVSDQFCLICILGQPQYKRQPCRHGEIFEIGRGV